VLFLDAFQASNATANGCGERLNVARRPTNERTKFALDHLNEFGVLSKDGCSCGAIKFLCVENQ